MLWYVAGAGAGGGTWCSRPVLGVFEHSRYRARGIGGRRLRDGRCVGSGATRPGGDPRTGVAGASPPAGQASDSASACIRLGGTGDSATGRTDGDADRSSVASATSVAGRTEAVHGAFALFNRSLSSTVHLGAANCE